VVSVRPFLVNLVGGKLELPPSGIRAVHTAWSGVLVCVCGHTHSGVSAEVYAC
jgi:hypothetical protein